MPSSAKTTNLQLNKWLGSDKPKKDDFNNDNQKLDTAHASLQSLINTVSQSLSTHSSGTQAHITSAERTEWNAKDKSTMGTYQGDGSPSRKITIGFQARIGILFAIGKAIEKVEFDVVNCGVYGGFFSSLGSTEGITADTSGFTVKYDVINRPSGMSMRLNEPGVTYIYVAWK